MDRPPGLKGRGKQLWDDILGNEAYKLDDHQKVILGEACRVLMTLDKLNKIIEEKDNEYGLIRVKEDPKNSDENERVVTMYVDGALSEARQQQNVFKQLMAAVRLPDGATGAQPQRRGINRGAHNPSGAGAGTAKRVSSLDAARAKSA